MSDYQWWKDDYEPPESDTGNDVTDIDQRVQESGDHEQCWWRDVTDVRSNQQTSNERAAASISGGTSRRNEYDYESETGQRGKFGREPEIDGNARQKINSGGETRRKDETLGRYDAQMTSSTSTESANVQRKEVQLPKLPEKFKLLQMMLSAQKLKLDSCVKLELNVDDMKAVLVVGGDNVDDVEYRLMDNMVKILQVISSTASGPVDLSTGIAKLVLTERGDRWLAERLAQYHVIGVVYLSCDKAHAIAEDEQALTDLKNFLTKWFKTSEKQFETGHTRYLQSPNWTQFVDRLESSRLVKVTLNYSQKCVIVEGCSDDVANALAEIDAMLKMNDNIKSTIPLDRKSFDVLYYHRDEIELYAKRNQQFRETPVGIYFERISHCLKLSGSTDSVRELQNHIQSEYIDGLTSDTFDVDLPGLTLEDFKQPMDITATIRDPKVGYYALTAIQREFKCNVDVTSRSAPRHKVTTPRQRYNKTQSQSDDSYSGLSSPSSYDLGDFQSSPSSARTACRLNVEEGNLSTFNADVVVNPVSTSRPDWTKAGPITEELLKAVGDLLRTDLESNWPEEFGKDVVSTTVSGQIQAKKIYTVAVNVYKDDASIKLMEDLISACLSKAISEGMTSIAFPALGCGRYLKYTFDYVAGCFVRAEKAYGQKIKINIVVLDGRAKKLFQTAINKAVDTLSTNLASVSATAASPPVASTPAISSSTVSVASTPSIEVVQGSLADFDKADVLVNIIAANTRNLTKAGKVSLSLSEAGGPELQADYESQEQPVHFGKDVAVTDAYGSLKAKKIYHAAMRNYKDEHSSVLLHRMISHCMEKAAADQMASIAFPTVGCGNLGYSADIVIDCFLRAHQDVAQAAGIKVYILAFDNNIFRTFNNGINSASPLQKDRRLAQPASTPTAAETKRTPDTKRSNETMRVLVFEVTAVGWETVEKAKKRLHSDLKHLVDTDYVENDVIEFMGTDVEEALMALETADVRLRIDKDRNRVAVTGKKSLLQKTINDVRSLLLKEEQREQIDYHHGKKIRGVVESLRKIGQSREIHYPAYWKLSVGATSGKTRQHPRSGKHLLEQSSPEFTDVSRILMGTWDSGKVGLGGDAAGLKDMKYQKIKVCKIWRLENPDVYKKYDVIRKNLCCYAADNRIPAVNGLEKEDEISTAKLVLSTLASGLIPEINEYYLLHGARQNVIDAIETNGFDFRLNERGMMGKGVYFAESSTKADQYTDESSKRVGVNQPLYMFVARVLLGNVYISRTVQSYKRPPCSRLDCLKDNCSDKSHGRAFDSIIATHRPAPDNAQRLLFREFVIYDLAQSYPEYLIEYERLP